ncbi:hypothetical protein DHEL01_v203721 [Diaporthe helianthi]|uniref:2EXR domain-containing protein n=1 Tax=Diaporthe helianthi TaxID=158607 RepID=A0A2P5I5T2_DIAHE|nr:hypothetical protein DHEL01_v203721 [Diaporthe helianthi]
MSDAIDNGGNTITTQQMQDTCGRTSLFRLPSELRLMIWKFLVPDRKVLRARSCGTNLDPRRTDDRRFVFGFDTKVSQPIISQICAESRQCLLNHGNGHFVFGLGHETGLWWGPQDVLLFAQDCRTGMPHFLEYFVALNELMIDFKPMTLSPTTTGSAWNSTAPAGWSTISQLLDKSYSYGLVTLDRDSTNMVEAVFELTKLRRLWMITRSGLVYRSSCEFDDGFNEDRVLYNFCTDTPRTGLVQEPKRVTSFDMMRDKDWAL